MTTVKERGQWLFTLVGEERVAIGKAQEGLLECQLLPLLGLGGSYTGVRESSLHWALFYMCVYVCYIYLAIFVFKTIS